MADTVPTVAQIRLPVRLSTVRVIGGNTHGHRTKVDRLGLPGLDGAKRDRDEDRTPPNSSTRSVSFRPLEWDGRDGLMLFLPFSPLRVRLIEAVEVRAWGMPDGDSIGTVEF